MKKDILTFTIGYLPCCHSRCHDHHIHDRNCHNPHPHPLHRDVRHHHRSGLFESKSIFSTVSELILTASASTAAEHSHLFKCWRNIRLSLLENRDEVTGRLRILCGEVSI